VGEYLPGVVLEKDRYGCHLFVPAYCVQRSCRRANACLGNKDGPCLADERKEKVPYMRWVAALKYLKAHRKLPAWFNPPHTKDPETEESRAQDRAIRLEFVRRLWNCYRQIKAFPESRAKMSEMVLLMLDMIDFSKIKDPNPIRPAPACEAKCDPEPLSGPLERPVISQPRIRVLGD
jgi:hypothetical protein